MADWKYHKDDFVPKDGAEVVVENQHGYKFIGFMNYGMQNDSESQFN